MGYIKGVICVLSLMWCGLAYAEGLLDVEPLAPDQLAESSGRQGVPLQLQFNDTDQMATVTGNRLSGNVVTGANSISDHAFDNMSGIATVIQNSGNQVVIQDSTQVNILINR
ncbi:hypothetical protein [Marinobacter sp. S0848L]|jgi:hypothetical protein|uniref:hypothetical protein n=1 Tax=Marinobacter sp. S0848L TaxID=2926423 RepID=UPI001FF5D02C|nr:hypothetical protein [Marinobacter sp. S0848L]MCK0105199.1 hypothetical protein [Marinobacter sp. S0848L]